MGEPSINFHIQTQMNLFKIPVELIKKNFKGIQKLVEKQKKQVTEDIAQIKQNPNLPPKDKLIRIDGLIKSFDNYQKKLKVLISKDEELRSRLNARLENLSLLSQYKLTNNNNDDTSVNDKGTEEEKDSHVRKTVEEIGLDLHNNNLINWYRVQTNLLIVDYLIKSNTSNDTNIGISLLKSLAEKDEKYLKLIDYDLFESFNKIYISIARNRDLAPVITWFNENRSFLKKVNSNLEFEINYCKFLSLIEGDDVSKAIEFSKKNLSPYGNINNYQPNEKGNYEKNLTKLKEIGGLLVYVSIYMASSTQNSKPPFSSNIVVNSPRFQEYEKLLSNERWESLSRCFSENFTKLYSIPKSYPLYIYLSAGLSSLKTKSCYCNTENSIFNYNSSKSNLEEDLYEHNLATDKKYRSPSKFYKLLNKINNCPICSPELYQLSKNLPYAQLITSIFNNPFKLPNGNIYSFNKLLSPSNKYLSEKNTLLRMGKIKDPLTREIFLIDNCIRVYPA